MQMDDNVPTVFWIKVITLITGEVKKVIENPTRNGDLSCQREGCTG